MRLFGWFRKKSKAIFLPKRWSEKEIGRINHLSKYFAFEEHVDIKWIRDVLRLEFPNIIVLKVKGNGPQVFLLGDNGRMGRLEVIKDEKVTFNEYTEGGFFSEGKVQDKWN